MYIASTYDGKRFESPKTGYTIYILLIFILFIIYLLFYFCSALPLSEGEISIVSAFRDFLVLLLALSFKT